MLNKNLCVLTTFAVLHLGCSNVDDTDPSLGEGLPLEEVNGYVSAAAPAEPGDELTDKACTTRADFFDSFEVGVNDWGWGDPCFKFCPAGSYVYSYVLKDEDEQGSGDDTAVNAVRLNCFNRMTGGFAEQLISAEQQWGDWYHSNVSPSTLEPATAATAMRVPSRGKYDDVSMLSLDLRTRSGHVLTYDSVHFNSMGATNWPGVVGSSGACPSGTAICGLTSWNETVHWSSPPTDDTALNSVEFACCTF